MEEVLRGVAAEGAEVMVATHNQGSIEATVRLMGEMGIEPPRGAGVFFGQLLGMADHLTFTLGRAGYRVRPLDAPPHSTPSAGWIPRPPQRLYPPPARFTLRGARAELGPEP